MFLSMDAKLVEGRPIRFSETARSRPGHPEARRDRRDGRPPAIGARRLADDVAERAAERAETGEADVEADLGDAPVGLAQEEHRALDPAALEVAVRRLAERRPERADEVRLRDVRDARQARHVERLRLGAAHRVAGAQHPAVGLLGGAAHPLMISIPSSRNGASSSSGTSASVARCVSALAGPLANAETVPNLSRDARPTTRSARWSKTRRTSASSW